MSDDAYAYGRARDERLTDIRNMIEVEAALQDGAAFAMAIKAIEDEAENAKNQLVQVNPADIGSIAAFQADVRSAMALRNFLNQIINRGKEATVSLHEDPYARPSYE